ncbi:MAG: secretin N-terminal domain-containing protein [Parachlamydiales bacterium]|jgi:type III secretion protein C
MKAAFSRTLRKNIQAFAFLGAIAVFPQAAQSSLGQTEGAGIILLQQTVPFNMYPKQNPPPHQGLSPKTAARSKPVTSPNETYHFLPFLEATGPVDDPDEDDVELIYPTPPQPENSSAYNRSNVDLRVASVRQSTTPASFYPIAGNVEPQYGSFLNAASGNEQDLWNDNVLSDQDWEVADERLDPDQFVSSEPLQKHFRELLEGPGNYQTAPSGAAVGWNTQSGYGANSSEKSLEGATAIVHSITPKPQQQTSFESDEYYWQEQPLQQKRSVGLVLDSSAPSRNYEDYNLIAQAAPVQPTAQPAVGLKTQTKPIQINFNNIAITEYIHFVSRLTNRNFIYDENDLQFNVTIVSEEAVTVEEIMATLLQVLRIHDLSIIEEGDNFLIHRNPGVKGLGNVVIDNYGNPYSIPIDADIITQVIQLNTLDAQTAQNVISNLISSRGIVEVFRETNHLVISDFRDNVRQIVQVLRGVDAPASSQTIGQYVVRNTSLDSLVELAQSVLKPIAREQPLTLVPHGASNSIFIMTSPFIMERIMPILYRLDQRDGTTGVYDLKNIQFMNYDAWRSALRGDETPEGAAAAALKGRVGTADLGPDGLPGSIDGLRGKWELDDRGRWVYKPTLQDNLSGSETNPFIPGLAGTVATPGAPPIPIDFTKQGQSLRPGGVGNLPLPTDIPPPDGYWKVDPQGNWYFQQLLPGQSLDAIRATLPVDENGNLLGPKGHWIIDGKGLWIFELSPDDSIYSGQKARFGRLNPTLPVGFVERTKFYIYKLQFRKGDAIDEAIKKIGLSLLDSEAINAALITTINSIQWLEESNSLVFSGPPEELDKVIELINEMDIPLRQVFIEMLILDTTITDSLNYGVNWATRFGGGNFSGSQGFIAGASTLPQALNSTGVTVNAAGQATASTPNGTQFASSPGYTLGIIGQHIVNKAFGLEFNSIGALITALHERNIGNVILNPKILTEDGVPAEIFVGINTQFRTNSVANNTGDVITSNFEFRDIGTRLTVTPTLGPSNIITLDIAEEVSNVINNPTSSGGGGGGQNGLLSDAGAGPTTSKNTTKTRVHIPDGYFLIISGMIQDDETRYRNEVPCLGGAPLLGALFSYKTYSDSKRNLMIFIRPKLIDTEEEINNLTRHQQNIFKIRNKPVPMWKHEVKEALNFLNVGDFVDCGGTGPLGFPKDEEVAELTHTQPDYSDRSNQAKRVARSRSRCVRKRCGPCR